MSHSLTNTHIHIFNSACVSKNFLRVLPFKSTKIIAPYLLKMLDTSAGRAIIKILARISKGKNSKNLKVLAKYTSFLEIALQATQTEVLNKEMETAKMFDPNVRVVALTMNMDLMDEVIPPMDYLTQLEDVKNIKRYYPNSFFPFLGIDPRHVADFPAVNWAKNYFEKGILHEGNYYPYFSGLKLYPALGYFPFDKRLLEIYKYAEKNEIPVMTHCTRVGSMYIGRKIENLIPRDIESIAIPSINIETAEAYTQIEKRVGFYYANDMIKNNKIGSNDLACDLFGHPENYIPILNMYPNLKICLAHMGGSSEIIEDQSSDELNKIREIEKLTLINGTSDILWFDKIRRMMMIYPNLYTDISYTLCDFDNTLILNKFLELLNDKDIYGNSLSNRVLFGTDFFMTEQEKTEQELFTLTKAKLSNYWNDLTVVNPAKYLGV